MPPHNDESRDLLFAMFALKRGLIDQVQVTAAFDIWRHGIYRTMGEILLEEKFLDESGRAVVEGLVANHLAGRARQPKEYPGAPRRQRDRVAPPADHAPAATVSHLDAGHPAADAEERDRTTTGEREAPVHTAGRGERFQIIRPYARGGLGEVFLALDPELDRQVALKELRAYHAFDPVSQSRFLLEARVTGRLEHPGIVPVYGLGRYADGRPYYAMRLIEGETLRQAIDRFHGAPSTQPGRDRDLEHREREIAFRRLLKSLIDACNAVAYAHSRGVVHRDIKPENIMLGRFGETLVVDWGVAKPMAGSLGERGDGRPEGVPDPALALADDASLTRPGSAIGTPQYMSPEQAAGELELVGPASDVYGLGATLYCLLVGHGPFPSGGVADVLERVRRGIFPAPRQVSRSIDPALETICLKAMSLEASKRHASALGLAEEIEAWLADVRFRSEQERALHDVTRSLARLSIERASNLFGREMPGEGMLWLVRALENVPPDSPGLERALRLSLAGWHAAPKLLERTLAHRGRVNAVAFSPDGRRMATGCDDRTARLWDVAKGGMLSAPMNHEGAVRAVAFSPDGRLLATAGDDGALMRWDALSGAPVGDASRHHAPINELQFSPDGSLIMTASPTTMPRLWDGATGRLFAELGGHDAEILAIAFHPDGSRLAAAGDNGLVWMWETATHRLLDQVLRHDAAVTAVSLSPDGQRLLTGCRDGRARIWDMEQGTMLAELVHRAEVGCVAFCPEGRFVATACADSTGRIWDADTARPICEPLAHRGRVDCLAFSADGTIVAMGSQDGNVRLWDAATGLPIGPPLQHRGALCALRFAPDSRRLATVCSDDKARCWRVPDPITGDLEQIGCWVRVATELELDESDVTRRLDQLALWELRRRLYELGGPPVR
jgi:WD40 repeat protein/tRNA A-37 threonylcarbamoyl transferase component Bud32